MISQTLDSFLFQLRSWFMLYQPRDLQLCNASAVVMCIHIRNLRPALAIPACKKKLYRYSPVGKTYKRGQNGFSQENTVGASKHGTCQFAYHKAWNLSRPRQEQTKYASHQWVVDVMSAGTWRLHGKHEALIPKPKPITLNIPYLKGLAKLRIDHTSSNPIALPAACFSLGPLSRKCFNHLSHDGVQLTCPAARVHEHSAQLRGQKRAWHVCL